MSVSLFAIARHGAGLSITIKIKESVTLAIKLELKSAG